MSTQHSSSASVSDRRSEPIHDHESELVNRAASIPRVITLNTIHSTALASAQMAAQAVAKRCEAHNEKLTEAIRQNEQEVCAMAFAQEIHNRQAAAREEARAETLEQVRRDAEELVRAQKTAQWAQNCQVFEEERLEQRKVAQDHEFKKIVAVATEKFDALNEKMNTIGEDVGMIKNKNLLLEQRVRDLQDERARLLEQIDRFHRSLLPTVFVAILTFLIIYLAKR